MMFRLGRVMLRIMNCFTLGLLLIPLVTSLLVSLNPSDFIQVPTSDFSLQWYWEFFTVEKWRHAFINTLLVASATIAISFPIGFLAALGFGHIPRRYQALANSAIMMPLFVPLVVLGLGLLTFVRATGLWGTVASLAVAHSLWALPLVFVVLRSTLQGLDSTLNEAAAGLGANPWHVFREITLPLAAPGVFVAILFAFVISVNEFIMSLFLATPNTATLPVAIWPEIRYMVTPIVAAASSVIIIITVLVLGIAARLVNIHRLVEFR